MWFKALILSFLFTDLSVWFEILQFDNNIETNSHCLEVAFYENEQKIASINNNDILEVDWNIFSFKLKTDKIKVLDSIKIDGVSTSYAIISVNDLYKVKVGVCSSISSNCFPRTRSTFWYNYEKKSLFENGHLILHPPVTGKFEEELLDLQSRATYLEGNK